MKMVIAVIKPHRLDHVKKALQEQGVVGMTVSDAKGFGRQRGHTEIYRGSEYRIDFVPKTKIELALQDEDVDRTIHCIQESARTDKLGDGKIFILPIEEVVRIRTGESGPIAI
jgi:nitrogen regulatory protein PII